MTKNQISNMQNFQNQAADKFLYLEQRENRLELHQPLDYQKENILDLQRRRMQSRRQRARELEQQRAIEFQSQHSVELERQPPRQDPTQQLLEVQHQSQFLNTHVSVQKSQKFLVQNFYELLKSNTRFAGIFYLTSLIGFLILLFELLDCLAFLLEKFI